MQWEEPKCYAVKHKDDNVIAASRSGGIFTALSDMVLNDGGVVYGCALTEDFRAMHIRAEDEPTRNRMRGSKYVQSSLGDTFYYVKADLSAGKEVLFSGTSCQIAGLRGFLGQEWENLLCVDIVCHGVPSPKVWKAYLEWQEQTHTEKVVEVNFRNKKDFGWRETVETLTFSNGRREHSKVFAALFYGHNILRPACYECRYKKVIHPGDITIADYWGVEKAAPEFDDNKGVSLVLVNNDHGEAWLKRARDCVNWKQTQLRDSMQMPLVKPYTAPPEREKFWSDFKTEPFKKIAYRYAGAGLFNKIKRKMKAVCKRATRSHEKGGEVS